MTLSRAALALTCLVCGSSSPSPDLDSAFAEYVAKHGRAYTSGSEEFAIRKTNFEKAARWVENQNNKPGQSWRAHLNKLADRTPEELAKLRGWKTTARPGHSSAPADAPSTAQFLSTAATVMHLPSEHSWMNLTSVQEVQDQGGCGSCWAFASTETVESAVAIATGQKPPVLSPQELVSCAPNPEECGGTGGCQGSTEPLAFQYVQQVGMTTEAVYPYQGRTGTCDKSKVGQAVVNIKGFKRLPTNEYGALMQAVAGVGPIAISLDASWGGYETGVYTGSCGTTIDHAVQLVGYGTDAASSHDYWLVRNSCGATWGEKGYIRIQRFGEGKEPCGTDTNPLSGNGCKGGPSTLKVCGLCGILSDSSHVTGASSTPAGIVV